MARSERVIRRPDVSDAEFMGRMAKARALGGIRGLVEALIAECEIPEPPPRVRARVEKAEETGASTELE